MHGWMDVGRLFGLVGLCLDHRDTQQRRRTRLTCAWVEVLEVRSADFAADIIIIISLSFCRGTCCWRLEMMVVVIMVETVSVVAVADSSHLRTMLFSSD